MASFPSASTALTFTGERFTPEVRGPIWYEHWHRYAFVASIVRGLRVLDAACGEGYGSFLLARAAAQVTGIDISADAVTHARERYASSNLAFVQGSVTQLPLPDHSVDVVVSFGQITTGRAARNARGIPPGADTGGRAGHFLPNRPIYNEAGSVENHFHVSELDRAELKALLRSRISAAGLARAAVVAQSALWAEEAAS